MSDNKKIITVNNPTQINIDKKDNSYQDIKKDVQNINVASTINDLGKGLIQGFFIFIKASLFPLLLAAIIFIGAMALWHGQSLDKAYYGMFKLLIFTLTEVIPFLFIRAIPFIIIILCVCLYSYYTAMNIAKILYKDDIEKQREYIKASSLVGAIIILCNFKNN